MRKDLSPKYISSSSYAKKQTIPINSLLDPRLNSLTSNFKIARQNAEVVSIGLNKPLGAYLLTLQNSANLFSLDNPKGDPSGTGAGTSGSPNVLTAPLQIANLVVNSYNSKGISITFDFDLSDPANLYVTSIDFQVYSPSDSKYLPAGSVSASSLSSSSISQTVVVTPVMMQATGLSNYTNFTKIEVATYAGTLTNGWVEANLPTYSSGITKPIITVSKNIGSYDVSITNLAAVLASGATDIQIQSFTTNDTLTQVQAEDTAGTSTWVNAGPFTKISPVSYLALDGAHRWIRAYGEGIDGGKSDYSDYKDVTPDQVNPSNLTAPTIWTSATAAWVGNDIQISWVAPSSNAGAIVKVKLVPYINGVESTALYALFSHTIAPSETSFTITEAQMFGQLGTYYPTYKAYISGLSLQGVETASQIQYGPITRTSNLTTAPTATTQNTVDGYYVQFSLGSQGATFGQIYQYYINPSFYAIHPPDYMDLVYSSGGASGTNTFVASSITLENGSYTLPSGKTVNDFIGMQVTGNNVPNNTWITGISGTGPYTVTLNNNFTAQASGTYRSQSLVYTGTGPANIFSNYYGNIYLIVVLYDNYNNTSPNSIVYTVTPVNPAQSVINNSVRIGAPNGAIWVGNNTSSKDTGARVVLGSSLDGNYSGIFAFDAGSTSGSAATTSIISNDNNGHSYTFETQNARIANWIIKANNIVNDQYGSAGSYTGLSSNGTYAFWAGANDNVGTSANFSVTPSGQVVAKKITINGDGTGGNLIYAGGGNFTVSQTGVLTATGATIYGSLNVTLPATFGSNINMSSAGILSAFGVQSDNVTPATQEQGSSVQIRGGTTSTTGGVFSYDKSHNLTTGIYSIPVGNTGYTFSTYKALLGTDDTNGWIVQNNTIQSGNTRITFDANGQYVGLTTPSLLNTASIRILSSDNSNYGTYLAANGSTSKAIAAGLINSSSPDFYVNHDGSMYAANATIKGTIKGGNKTSYADGQSGYYLGPTGNFEVANGNTNNGYIRYDGNSTITLQANSARVNGVGNPGSDGTSAYSGPSKIDLLGNGVIISGLPVQGNIDMSVYTGYYYRNAYPLGPYPRQRMLVEDPVNGQTYLGMAVYYGSISSAPSASSGYVGDLWVSWA